ncbi:lycopene cyclase domain-containing protein [Dermatophilaceae bacterium Soc4.6]
MTYTAAAALGVVVALALDLVVVRTRLVVTRQWWFAYAIIVFFQLVTNGWLTGRRIVTYDPAAIIGNGSVPLVGDGRLVFAPVEDLAFGFALVLATCVLWVRLGGRGRRQR